MNKKLLQTAKLLGFKLNALNCGKPHQEIHIGCDKYTKASALTCGKNGMYNEAAGTHAYK